MPFEMVRKLYLSHALFVSLLLVLFTPFQLHHSSAMDLLTVCLVTGVGLFVAGSVSFHLIHGYLQKHNIRRTYFIYAEVIMTVTSRLCYLGKR